MCKVYTSREKKEEEVWHHYILNSEETLLTAVAKEEGIFKERVEGKEEYKKWVDAEKKEEVGSMKLHRQFERDTRIWKQKNRGIG